MEGKLLYKNKYKIKSTRWDGYDYSQSGFYFVTFCTKNSKPFFGVIKNEKMLLNNLGRLAVKYWLETPKHFNNVILDEYIIMPNHVHGIIMIDNELNNGKQKISDYHIKNNAVIDHGRDEACLVSTDADNQLNSVSQKIQKISPKPKSLSVIIGSYKSAVARESKSIMSGFMWQARFYDHVIRNDQELHNIQNYIINNPIKWEFDRNNPDNLK